MKFRMRVDETDMATSTSLAQWAKENSREYVVVHHLVNENSHFHLYMDSPMVMSPPAMRYKVKTPFKLDNVQYSVKSCSDEREAEYLSYLFNTKHDNVATLVCSNLAEDRLEAAMASARVISDTFAKSRTIKPKPKSLYDIAIEIRETLKSETNVDEILTSTIRLLHKYCKCHDKYMIMKVMTTVQTMIDPSSTIEHIKKFYLNN